MVMIFREAWTASVNPLRWKAGLPDFSCYNTYTERGKNTTLAQNIPNGYKIYRMAV
jgi:hypothetical protein